jgi:putative transcription factor
MSHQDWDTVVLKSNKHTSTEKKPVGPPCVSANKAAQKVDKIVESDAKLEIKTINPDAVKAIIKQRCILKLSQKELAVKCCITDTLLRNIEQGKEPHNPTVLIKIQKVLCVKLLGDNIGTPLADKKTTK